MLEGSSEFIVEPLDEGDDAAGDAEDLARGDGGEFLVIIPLLGVFDDYDLLGVFEQFEELLELLGGTEKRLDQSLEQTLQNLQLPLLLWHLVASAGSQIETC